MTEKRQVERHEKPALAVESQPTEAVDLLVSYLEQIGVEYVFCVPGGAIEPLYNALARSARRGGPRAVVARHEAGAAFMADGYARESGKIGVCCGTSGPGSTNLITGVACAYENEIPMLVITGQPSL
ncbi:MAG: thiamine pyrophosphate-binding protein, partial [Gallionella sp.]